MSRRTALTLFALTAAVALTGCGGGTAVPTRPGMDLDSGETAGGQHRPSVKRSGAAPLDPSQIAVLSLDGIPMPAPPAGEANAEGGKDQQGPKTAPPATAADPNAPPPRNLFSFEEDPAVVAERRRVADEAAAKAAEAAKKAEWVRTHTYGPPPPPPPPQPPAIPFQFIGYMGPPESRIGVFTGPNLFLAKKGEVVMTQFKIVSIGYESAEIGFTGFAQTQRIPLTAGGK